jgi:hypothetical protein
VRERRSKYKYRACDYAAVLLCFNSTMKVVGADSERKDVSIRELVVIVQKLIV